jgi:VWFA-related protein
MKRAILFCLIANFSWSASAATNITVDQLNSEVIASHGERDSKIASRIATLHLTERLSTAKLSAMEAALPGPESRQALVTVADQAEFLNPPAAEIPSTPAPSVADQRAMIAKTIEYVHLMQLRLPNLLANRDTIHFEDSPPGLQAGTANGFNPAQPLHAVSRTTVVVSYRSGKDFVQVAGKEQPASILSTRGLSSFGEFGPVLSTVLIDLPQGKLAWSHWEQHDATRVAVFGFSVPKAASHYAVRFCCVGTQTFQQFSSYHGELAINPDAGTILRLTLMADLAKDDPIKKADLMVEYGAVELGGRTYFCPAKSIAVSVAPSSSADKKAGYFRSFLSPLPVDESALDDTPMQTMINEVHFDQYHLFGSESRVLTASDSVSSLSPNVSTRNPVEAGVPVPSETSTVVEQPTNIQPASSGHGTSTARIAEATTPPTPVSEPVGGTPAEPEINVIAQMTPTIPDAATSNEAKFSLRVTTRIVDVSVAAFDKRGQPVTDLTPSDFEIIDDGCKQSLRSFTRASASRGVSNHTPLDQPNEFSNRIDSRNSSTQTETKAISDSTTIILFDATSLAFNDLTNARNQMHRVLDKLPPSEPVGLYVRTGLGFRVLVEGTVDRAAFATALRDWRPDAREIAQAQEDDQRNRGQFDTLHTAYSVLATYSGVGDSDGGGSTIGSDPALFNQGSEPTRAALSVLVGVAAHMGAIPGHKNLVWIAGDNVLVNWSDQSVSGDEGRMTPNSIGLFSIRTQEALNNAQVSLYPFDASQLESSATDASLANEGVRLDPSQDNSAKGFPTPPGGRSLTISRTVTHDVQPAIQQLAEATGGQAFGKSSDVIANLNHVIEESRAVYLLSFSPDTQPDDKYHQLKVTVPRRRDVRLRYRTGYLYSKEPASLKGRFAQVLWQPFDASEIAITARRSPSTGGSTITLNIAAADIGLIQKDDRWTDKIDVFLAVRDETGVNARVSQQTLALNLARATYGHILRDGIPFQQYVDDKQKSDSLRIIVIDENSGRMGSITLPAQK